MNERVPTFPLVPRRRVIGVPFGTLPSARRGTGFEVAGSRPYQRGDDIRRIDRYASARLSSATGGDEFVVREYYAEEGAHVVVAVDGSPTMALFPERLPWLRKPAAVAEAARMIVDSALAARCVVQRLPSGSDGPGEASVTAALRELLARPRGLPSGSFVFLLSDFLAFPSDEVWSSALARGWDVVPVVVQDPVWEQTFPDVGGTVLPLADPKSGRVGLVRLRGKEARARKEENESRLASILARFEALGLTPVRLSSHEPGAVHLAFLEWADARRRGRRSVW